MISTRAADMAKKGRLHPVLEEAVDALGISGQVPALRSAARLSQSLVEDARSFLQKEVRPSKHTPIDVLVFGSIARQEATHESDFDYLVVAHGLPKRVTLTRELLAAAEQTRERLDLKRPGAAGMFGRVIAAADLTERIGLEQDTNANHSHRILILEESVSVYQPRLRKTLIQAILARYLADYEQPKLGVPRFLLNDVLRYWRTLAVDYQAKRWEQVAPDWGLRYLKLIISRKLTFAGTLATLLCTEQASIPYFTVQFEMPALARLAQLHQLLEPALRQHLATAILIAEEFTQAVSDEAFRNEARAIKRRADIRSGTRFGAMHQKGRALQTALAAIFFDSGKLRERSRKYLSF